MGKNLYPPGAIFCRHCGYCLHGLPNPRCPECGHDFDPADSKTFRRTPRRLWPRRLVVWGGIPLLLLMIAYGGLLGWLYMGYRAEAGARALKVGPYDRVRTQPILSAKLAWLLPQSCRPWQERVDTLEVWNRLLTQQEIATIAACHRLRVLWLGGMPLKAEDVGLIIQCRELEELRLIDNGLMGQDAAGLSALKRLRVLDLEDNPGLDDWALEAAGQLKELKELYLWRAAITDRGLTNLASLTNLETLSLAKCLKLTDGAVPHLSRLTGLKGLELEDTPLTPAAAAQLKQNLPQCKVSDP